MMKNEKRQCGFTLVEVVVAVAIFAVLMLSINLLFISLYRQQGVDMAIAARTQNMNSVISTMGRELRGCNRGENGNYPIAVAEAGALVFFSDADKDGETEKVSYVLDGTDLKKTVTEPGSDFSYAAAGDTATVCSEIQNGVTPAFTFFDKDYTGSQMPMPSPVAVRNVVLVGVSLTANTNGRNSSAPLHVETKIRLRNLN